MSAHGTARVEVADKTPEAAGLIELVRVVAGGGDFGPVSSVEVKGQFVEVQIDGGDPEKTLVLRRWEELLAWPNHVVGRRRKGDDEVRLNLRGVIGDGVAVVIYTTYHRDHERKVVDAMDAAANRMETKEFLAHIHGVEIGEELSGGRRR
jgi:hypothetical protein